MPIDTSYHNVYPQKSPEERLRARPIFNSHVLNRNSVYFQLGPSCSSKDLEQVVGCACYIGWRLRYTFNTESLQNECRDQGDDFEQLNVFCQPYIERENRVPVQRFFEFAKTVQQFCFEQTSVQTTLSSTVVRAERSKPPKPRGKLQKISNKIVDFLSDTDFTFKAGFGAKGKRRRKGKKADLDGDGDPALSFEVEGFIEVDVENKGGNEVR